MATATLLSIVQDVMSDTSMDEVDSIEDTVDSLQVASIVKGVWLELVSLNDLPRNATFFQINATGTSTPTVLSLPDTVQEVQSIEYDSRSALTDPVKYVNLNYVEPAEFFSRTNGLDEDDTEVELISHSSGVTYKVYNDRHPTYFTIYGGKYVLCDSYLSDLDNNLQQSKTRCLGVLEPAFTMDDAFVIELDTTMLHLLREKSTARVFARLQKMRDADSERAARRLEIRAQNTKDKLRGGLKYPDYGRRR